MGASPESRASAFPAFLDVGLAASRRPGMTTEGFSNLSGLRLAWIGPKSANMRPGACRRAIKKLHIRPA
jgi:hypothetical protein